MNRRGLGCGLKGKRHCHRAKSYALDRLDAAKAPVEMRRGVKRRGLGCESVTIRGWRPIREPFDSAGREVVATHCESCASFPATAKAPLKRRARGRLLRPVIAGVAAGRKIRIGPSGTTIGYGASKATVRVPVVEARQHFEMRGCLSVMEWAEPGASG